MRNYLLGVRCISLTLFLISSLQAGAQSPDSTLKLDVLIQKVMSQNPQLQAAQQDWRAGETRVSQNESLPDPTLGLNFMNLPVNSFALDQEPMTGKQITLMQMFPWPGTLRLKGEIARSSVQVKQQQAEELKNQLVKNLKQTYYDLYYVDWALETVAANKDLLNQFIEIAETRYGVGKGLQQDVIRAQVALSKLMDKEIKLGRQRIALEARINGLTDESADTPLGKPILPEEDGWSGQLEVLVQQADSTSPLLSAWKSTLQQSEQQVDLALKKRYPDFSVGVAYTQRDRLQNGMKGYDFLSAMFSIRLPLYHKKKQEQYVQENRIQLKAAEYRYQNVQNAVEQQLQQTLTEVDQNRRLIKLYEEGVIPQAEESLESSLAGYQNDKVDFLSLLDSEMTLFNLRLDYYRIRADYHKALAEVEALTGTEL